MLAESEKLSAEDFEDMSETSTPVIAQNTEMAELHFIEGEDSQNILSAEGSIDLSAEIATDIATDEEILAAEMEDLSTDIYTDYNPETEGQV